MCPRYFSKLIVALAAAAALAAPAAAIAQQPPSYGTGQQYSQPTPPYGNQETIRGTVSSFDGQWIVYMKDDRGYTDHITLHQGTIIKPTSPMRVTRKALRAASAALGLVNQKPIKR